MDPREQIKAKIDIVAFIAEHIPLKQMGRNFKALCPFHGEKTPSFVVSAERQIWHCFGCGKGGDIFTFLMEFEKMDFLEALRTLAKRTGVTLSAIAPTKSDQLRERLLAINHVTSEFYHYILTTHKAGERAREYLTKRGIKKKTIETFMLGFAAAKWDLLLDFLTKKKGFSASDVEAAGLVIGTKNNEPRTKNRYYDRFRNRIMFTLRDHRGNVVGFAGRVLDPDVKEAKYVNTPETELYHKGELLFGLDVTKDAIKKEDQAIIVEGEFDVMQSFQEGVANVVALKGTALTIAQAKLIRRFTQHIALSFDVDVAGDAAARRGIAVAENEGLSIKVIQVKDGKDPDEVIRKTGAVGWKKAIKVAVPVYDFLIDSATARFDKTTSEGKKDITEEVLPTFATIANEIVKSHFVKRIALELDTSEEVILRQMEKMQKRSPLAGAQKQTPQALLPKSRLERLEEYLLALLLQKADKETIKSVHAKLESGLLPSAVLERVLHLLVAFYEKEIAFDIGKFTSDLPKELLPTVDRLYLFDTESVKPEGLTLEIEQVLRDLRIELLRKQMEQITRDLRKKEGEGETEELNDLKKRFNTFSIHLQKLTAER